MKLVATREQLHEMIDDLPEADVDPVAEILASRGSSESTNGEALI